MLFVALERGGLVSPAVVANESMVRVSSAVLATLETRLGASRTDTDTLTSVSFTIVELPIRADKP